MKQDCVKKMLFDDLVESIKEAGRIYRGEIPPSRKFVFEPMDIKVPPRRANRPRRPAGENPQKISWVGL